MSPEPGRKRGRKPLKTERMRCFVGIRVSQEEMAMFRRYVKGSGFKSVAAWARACLVKLAK
jgi:hypothetical protein